MIKTDILFHLISPFLKTRKAQGAIQAHQADRDVRYYFIGSLQFDRRGLQSEKRMAEEKPMAGKNYNPRRANGTLRNKHRARLKALGLPCAICGGIIHYGEPSDSAHPLSFVVDEKLPVSRWKEFGYSSAKEAAQDWNNLQPAHYICNATKSNKTAGEMARRMHKIEQKTVSWLPDGRW